MYTVKDFLGIDIQANIVMHSTLFKWKIFGKENPKQLERIICQVNNMLPPLVIIHKVLYVYTLRYHHAF